MVCGHLLLRFLVLDPRYINYIFTYQFCFASVVERPNKALRSVIFFFCDIGTRTVVCIRLEFCFRQYWWYSYSTRIPGLVSRFVTKNGQQRQGSQPISVGVIRCRVAPVRSCRDVGICARWSCDNSYNSWVCELTGDHKSATIELFAWFCS